MTLKDIICYIVAIILVIVATLTVRKAWRNSAIDNDEK